MIYIIWAIINLLIILYFACLIVGFFFIGRKIFPPGIRNLSILIMILGIVQIISHETTDDNKNNIVFEDNSGKLDYLKSNRIILEQNKSFDISIYVEYSNNNDSITIYKTISNLTGLTNGFVWEFKSINLKKEIDNIVYNIQGIINWNLFGINVYTEQKRFHGILK